MSESNDMMSAWISFKSAGDLEGAEADKAAIETVQVSATNDRDTSAGGEDE